MKGKRILALLAALAMVSLLCMPALAASTPYYTVSELGTVDAGTSLRVDYSGHYATLDGKILDPATGEVKLSGYTDIILYTSAYGYFWVSDGTTDLDAPDNVQLVRADGSVVVPGTATSYKVLSDRFVLVGYADGIVTDEDDADAIIMQHFGNWKSISIELGSPGYVNIGYFANPDSYINYSGYCRVYDLERGDFVPNLELTSARESVAAIGNVLLYEYYQGSSTVDMVYDASGNVLFEGVVDDYTRDRAIVRDDGYTVYDGDWQQVFATGYRLYRANRNELTGETVFVYGDINRDYGLMDADGNTLTEPVYKGKSDMTYYGSTSIVEFADGSGYGLVSMDGTTLFQSESGIFYLGCGYFRCRNNEVIDRNGNSVADISDATMYSDEMIYCKTNDNNKSYLIYSDGSWYSTSSRSDYFYDGAALLKDYDEDSGLYGVVDLFTGERIIPCAYSRVELVIEGERQFLYAWDEAALQWTIYELRLNGL